MAARLRYRLLAAADVDVDVGFAVAVAVAVAVDVRETVVFRVIVFLELDFFAVVWVTVLDWADAVSADRPRQRHAARTHQAREVFGNRGKITGNPLDNSRLQSVSAF